MGGGSLFCVDGIVPLYSGVNHFQTPTPRLMTLESRNVSIVPFSTPQGLEGEAVQFQSQQRESP